MNFPFPQLPVQSSLIEAIERINASRSGLGIDWAQSLTKNLPKFHLDLPALSVDYSRLFAPALNLQNLTQFHSVDTASLDAFRTIYEEQRKKFEKLFDWERIQKLVGSLFPPNWRGVDTEGCDLEALLLDEGLPLGWVPDSKTVQALFDASTPQERRKILGRRWKSILKFCRSNLDSVVDPKLLNYCVFAMQAIDSIEANIPAGGQALAANLLDTMLRDTLDSVARSLVTSQKDRLDLDDLPVRASIVFGGIWGSFTEFWASRGDVVPRGYSRHASAHAVGKRQYSRINAVIAVMHVTAYIKLLESGDLDG
ncbi:hypothetical protein [Nocardia ignorata]|nr:hypothetical protein [Nocardia ignorata]